MPSRRHFLSLSALAATAAAAPRSLLAFSSEPNPFSNAALGAYAQGLMTQEHLRTLVGSEFTVFLPDGRFAFLRLRAVSRPSDTAIANRPKRTIVPAGADPTASRAALQPSPFTLHFDARGPHFEQDTYLLDHGTLGRVSMFLVPGGPDKYSASFNNFVTTVAAPPRRQATVAF